MKSFLNIGATPKCTTYAHFALLIENSFTIKESGNSPKKFVCSKTQSI